MQKEFIRKYKEEIPVLAICYDFDKTLTITDMQAQGFIQNVISDDQEIKDFWEQSNKLSIENNMDQNLSYMFLMNQKARGKVIFNKKTLNEYGEKLEYFPGMDTRWFDRINKYGLDKNVKVEHYVISSGIKEIIDGTLLYKSGVFSGVYASSFYFDDDGLVLWPAQAINSTNKTKMFKLYADKRINYFCPANYTKNSLLEQIIFNKIDIMSSEFKLSKILEDNITEINEYNKSQNEENIMINNLISDLEDSRNFTTTHTIVAKLLNYTNFTK